MTDKQKEAIEFFENDIEKRKQGKNYFVDYEKVMIYEETVLNLLKTQQAEIEKKDKESHFIQSKLDEANAEIIKLKRIIDEMAECLYEDDTSFGYGNLKDVNTAEKIKQYFERKAKNGN